MERNVLLVSNSTVHGSDYLNHCAEEIKAVGRNRFIIHRERYINERE